MALPPQTEPGDENAPTQPMMENQSIASLTTSPETPSADESSFVRVDPATLSWKERRRQENIERKLKLDV